MVTDAWPLFFVKDFNALVCCWENCFNRGGDYIEK
jgi:hypothetical protein